MPPREQHDDAIPLTQANVDDEVMLVSLEGGRELQLRMAELGLIAGVQFRILNKGQPGPFIILLKQTRLVLGRGMIESVLVRPVPTTND
jgi:ferrous iron transport protein A